MQPVFWNKVVWITGASSGIGEALVYSFDSQGAKIIISARNSTRLAQVKARCTSEDNVHILPLDLSLSSELKQKANEALSKWGRIDIMIHNGGVAARALVEGTSPEVDRVVMETNYFGPVALTKAVLPAMLEKRSGHIVVVSSLSGKYGVPKLSSYSASKHALHGFFESLRAEVHSRGIDVSIVIPGFVKTQIILNSLTTDGKAREKNLSVNEKGMDVSICAEKIIIAIAKRQSEALIGGSEIVSVYLHRFFPNLQRILIRNHPVRRMAQLKNLLRLKYNVGVHFSSLLKMINFKSTRKQAL